MEIKYIKLLMEIEKLKNIIQMVFINEGGYRNRKKEEKEYYYSNGNITFNGKKNDMILIIILYIS